MADGPSCVPFVAPAMDPDLGQCRPNDVTHRGRVFGTKGIGNPDPPICPEMFQHSHGSGEVQQLCGYRKGGASA
jgi:hypothetical protein